MVNENDPRTSGRRGFLQGAAGVAVGAATLPVLGTIAWSGANPAGASTTPASARIPEALRPGGEFDKFVARLAAEDKFSGTVLLTHRNRPVLERAYGMADKARSVPNRPDTRFSLGSVTKLFTGIAIAQQVQRGRAAYHEKIGTYLDGYAPEVADTVTIHQLLTHTSGLGDYMQLPGFWDEAQTWDSVEEAWEGNLRYVRKDTLAFPPGSGNRYSNSGFVTLGAIVAAVSGQSYYEYVRKHIFQLAGTGGSEFHTAPQWRADRGIAHPYVKGDDGQWVDVVDDRQTFVGTPAGGSFATATDLARLVKALREGKLLDPRYAELALSPKVPKPPTTREEHAESPRMGFSNYLTVGSLVSDQWTLGHGGGAPGVSANLHWFPDSDWVSVVLANYHDAAAQVYQMASRLILE